MHRRISLRRVAWVYWVIFGTVACVVCSRRVNTTSGTYSKSTVDESAIRSTLHPSPDPAPNPATSAENAPPEFQGTAQTGALVPSAPPKANSTFATGSSFTPRPVPNQVHCWAQESRSSSRAPLLHVALDDCSMAINSMCLEPGWDQRRVFTKRHPYILPKAWRPRASPCMIRVHTDIGTPDNVVDMFSLLEVYSHVWWILRTCERGLGGRSKLGREKGFEATVMGVPWDGNTTE